MASTRTTYVVQRGDSLWKIATNFASSISGNTTNAKINTLVKLNNIKNKNLIYVGQKLKLSASGSSGSSTTTVTNKAIISGFGLQSDDTSGRAMIVNWDWTKGDTRKDTDGYTCRWKQHLNGKWIGSDTDISHPEDMYCQSTFTADGAATKVSFQVRPYYKSEDKTKYWSNVGWSDVETYDFSNNPPLTPSTPTVSIEDRTMTISIDNIKADELDAVSVEFNVVKDNTSSVYTSKAIPINTKVNYVSHQYTVAYGSEYKVRARSVSSKKKVSGWSDFSSSVGTKPSAPTIAEDKCRRNKRSDGSITAYLEWTAVNNATNYVIEYTTVVEDFETSPDNLNELQTEDARTSIEVTGIDPGKDYFFRVRAVNDKGESNPTAYVTIPIGEPPAAPTTWSSANSAFVGESMELNWTHNARDGSNQTHAQLSLKINNDDWVTYIFENSTTESSGEKTDITEFTYGIAVSYMGSLYVKMDTNNAYLKNSKIVWKVRTAGVTDAFSDTDWSVERTIHIYEEPTLVLSMVKDLADSNGTIIEDLDSFPFYIRGNVDLDSYELQRPIGYHLRIISNEFYETVDDTGRTKTVNPGEAVYSKYFDTSDILIVEMSADNIDLESGVKYSAHCSADMSTGLTVEQTYEFSVDWVDVEYVISANIDIDPDALTAIISPRCLDSDDNLVENTEIAVYRREYDGTFTEVAKNIPNNGTAITDPHPSLDYARYRLVAKDTITGAVSFYDMMGHPVHCTSVIIQWDEAWSTFDIRDEYLIDGPSWSGSMVKLPYNVDVTDNRKREVELVKYAGRENPVSYYGTHRDETSSWSMTIPKNDKDTIYALRRLSLWAGDVYVREPSGMGYWANISVSFSQKHNDVTIPVTLEVTRVEGGV